MKKQMLTILCAFALCSAVYAEAPLANGKYVKYFPGGKQPWEVTWRKDERVIRRKVYHKNGKLYRDIVYKNGQPTVERSYYTSGRLKSVWTAKTQELRRYREDGSLKRVISTGPDGIRLKDISHPLIFDR